jgi:acyl carrier protein
MSQVAFAVLPAARRANHHAGEAGPRALRCEQDIVQFLAAGQDGDQDFILRRHLPLSNGAVAPDVPLADLGLDSLATASLVMEMEDSLGISIPDDVLTPETCFRHRLKLTQLRPRQLAWATAMPLRQQRCPALQSGEPFVRASGSMTTVRYGAASRARSSGSAVCTTPPPASTATATG